MENKSHGPIKRSRELQRLSKDHHFSLLFCWKIRQGLKSGIETTRIKRYTDWFGENYLLPHFKLEEKYIFPILGDDDHLIKKALAEHRRLRRLLNDTVDVKVSLNRIEEELDKHVRFEERVLFKQIEAIATAEQLDALGRHDADPLIEAPWEDEFWVRK